MSTKQRKHLNDYTDAARQIELAGACINVLEMMRGTTAERCIKALRAEQHRSLTRLDKAAERLGAPYPSPPLVYGGTDGCGLPPEMTEPRSGLVHCRVRRAS